VRTDVATLSVVLPFRNTERHLGAALESIAGQTFGDLDVIMVDDGSADASTVIAKSHAARDPRFRLIQQEVRGASPQAARTIGVAHATGRYLAFAGGDGLVAPRAYELLVRSLETTGSDIACGRIARLGPGGVSPYAPHEEPFRKSVPRTHVSQRPALLQDQACWNKVCRRSLWDRAGLTSPGPRHEIAPAMIRAHVLASSVDVLRDVVYYWWLPDTADPPPAAAAGRLPDVEERMAAAADVASFLQATAPELKPAYDRLVLRGDLTEAVAAFELAGAAERARITELAGGYLRHVPDSAYHDVPAIRRLHYYLLGNGMLAQLLDVLRYSRRGEAADTPVVPRGDRRSRWCAAYPFFRDPAVAIPDKVYDVTSEMTLNAGLDAVGWREGRLRIEGHAYIRRLSSATPDECAIRVSLRNARTRRTIRLPVERVLRPDVTARSQQGAVSYDWSGFVVEIEPQRLATLPGVWRGANWELMVSVAGRGLRRKAPLNSVRAGSAQWPQARWVTESVRVQPAPEQGGRFVIQGHRVTGLLTGCRADADAFEIEGWSSVPLAAGATLNVSPRQGRARTVRVPAEPLPSGPQPGRTAFRARLPVSMLVSPPDPASPLVLATYAVTEVNWDVSISPGGGAPVTRLASAPATAGARAGHGSREVTAVVTPFGYLSMLERTARPVVTGLEWAPGQRLVLRGDHVGPGRHPDQLILRSTRSGQQHELPLRWAGDAFTAELRPAAMPGLAGPLPLSSGNWRLLAPAGPAEVPVAVARRLLPGLPGYHSMGLHEVEAQPYRTDALQLNVRTALAGDERGRYAQRRLRTHDYPKAGRRLRDLAVFDSFAGQHYSCNPRAIYEEVRRRYPDLDCVWITSDGGFTVPDGGRVVLASSREHYDVLAQARYVIFNDMLPPWFVKREGQTCLQTWHGTPLKRIGFDVSRPHFASGLIYNDLLRQDVAHWDLLLSPNEFATPIFRRAFGYDGEILQAGYPRNDPLHGSARRLAGAKRAAALRRLLGLPDGKRVVLYAPTWRDDAAEREGRYRFDMHLDLDAAAGALGEDHVLLLRLHTKARGDASGPAGGFVTDVTRYPDITDLYLVSDVLITDYSSVMFDFAGTGRPILFFTYDLERYRDIVRGLYVDFEAEAPGPLLRTTDEVIGALRDLDGVTRAYRDAYGSFAGTYCALDDGEAAARVVRRLLGPR
jgi:CDP-glycerol glycerophosphotransferase